MTSDQKLTHFRCVSCESEVYSIHKQVPHNEKPILDFHKEQNCKIEYYTKESRIEYLKSETPSSNTDHLIKSRYSMDWFIHKCTVICKMGFEFSRHDFPQLSKANYRTYVCRATKKGLIQKTLNGLVPSFWVVGLPYDKERGTVTLKGMGVGLEFEQRLRDCGLAHPAIHDIRLKIPTSEFYDNIPNSVPKDPTNGRIFLGEHKLKDYVFAKISAYPKSIEIIIECSTFPLIYDTAGAGQFISMMGEIRGILMSKSYNLDNDIPPAISWIVTEYHFNKDGTSMQYSGESFEITVNEMSTGLIRFYSHKFPNGVTRARLEQVRTPQKSLIDVTTEMIMTDNYVNNRSGIKLTHEQACKVLDIIPKSNTVTNSIISPIVVVNYSPIFNPLSDRLYSL